MLPIREIKEQLFSPETIYSRHKAEDILGSLIEEDEAYVFGIDKRDSIFRMYRTYWFLTDIKIVLIENEFPRERTVMQIYFVNVKNMRLFDEDNVLVIERENDAYEITVTSELEQSFARQTIEQYDRYVANVVASSET